MIRKILAGLVCVCLCVAAMGFVAATPDLGTRVALAESLEQSGLTAGQLTFYRSGAADMTLSDGVLQTTADGEQKAMVNEAVFSASELELEFTVAPSSPDGAINHGVYFHAKNAQSSYQKIHALNVQVKRDEGAGFFQIFLRSFLDGYIRDEQKSLKQVYSGGAIDLKLVVDEEDIYVYLDGSDVPSLTKRRHNTEQTGTQIGFRSYNASGTISNIRFSNTPVKPDVPTVKVLMVGNSFAVDAMTYVHEVARADGINFIASVLYYGGCTLPQHDDFITNRKPVYTLYKNGITDEENVGFYDAIYDEDWDIVTFQSTSVTSGLYNEWFPYIPKFLALAENLLPDVEVGLHMTWVSPYFMQGQNDRKLVNYNDSTDQAHHAVVATHLRIQQEHGVRFLIPTAVAMYNIHGTPVCNSTRLETSFCRDTTCHANEKGRYMHACTVYESIVGRSVVGNTYVPYGHTYGSDDGATLFEREVIWGVVDEIFNGGGFESLYWFGKPDGVKSITASTSHTRYREGDYFDYASLTVTAQYNDGRLEETDLFTIDLRRPLTKDDKAVTVSYRGCTVEIPITVV